MENWTVKSVDGEEVKSSQEQEQAVVEEAIAENENIEIAKSDDVIKVDLSNPPKQEADAVQQVQGETEESVLRNEGVEVPGKENENDKKENNKEEAEAEQLESVNQEESEATQESSEEVLELIQDEEPKKEVKEPVQEVIEQPVQEAPQAPELPEGIQGLMNFMSETGGSLEDYVNLNKSYDDMNDVDVINEYYRQTKPHLDQSEIEFLMSEKFAYDQEVDDPRDIKRKQLAFKEELYDAKKSLNANKEKYYKDLKLGAKLPQEAQEALSFHQEYKKSQEDNQKLADQFTKSTSNFFNDEFKGFDFKVADGTKYRFKVNDVAGTKDYQSDLNNFIGEFVGDSGTIEDVAGYHKALFAAKNADKLAQHFYEQGRADALKQSAKESKNIDMSPKGDAASVVRTKTGTQFKVVSGQSSSGLKFKMRK